MTDPKLVTRRVAIDALKPDPENVRLHSDRNIAAIKTSLDAFGQQKPIVVRPDGTVVAGNGTLEAAKQLGWTEIDVVETDLTGSALRAFAIADNRTAELAEWDHAALVGVLSSLGESDVASAGFTIEEVEALGQAHGGFGASSREPPTAFPSVGADLETQFSCPRCNYRWSGNPNAAAADDEVADD